MEFQFLGGAQEVGRQAMLLENDGIRLLIDYGFLPSKPPKYPEFAPPVDRLLLTHAHLDHCGMVAWMCGHHHTQVVATPPTAKASELMMLDSLKIASNEGYACPFTDKDLEVTTRSWDYGKFGSRRQVGHLDVKLHSAGHIPGATMFEVSDKETTVLFTGDINTQDTDLVTGCKPVRCDVLFMESTYAGREHPPREEVVGQFLDAVDATLQRGGKVLVPAFALGRMQEVLLLLLEEGHEVWADGMGLKVTDIFLQDPRYLRDGRRLRRVAENIHDVYSPRGRDHALKGDVIVTTSGMLEGGPVMRYLKTFRDDPKSSVFLTGYQVPGTNGRTLLDTGILEIDGVKSRLQCELRQFDLSAHSGHSELVEFVRRCHPETLVLMHGDQRELLAESLQSDCKVLLPKNMEKVEIPGTT